MAGNEKSPEIKFRNGAPEDARAFHSLDIVCFPSSVAFPIDLFHQHLRDHSSINIVAEKMGAKGLPVAVAGFIVAKVTRQYGQIVTMDVHPDFRKKGIAKSLLEMCEKQMVDMGARESILQVAVNNDPAYKLYQQSGYRPIARLPGYYPHPPPRGTDAMFMEKKLAK